MDAPDSDLFDVLSYVLYENTPKTRADRAAHVSDAGLDGVEDELKLLLTGILSAYVQNGEGELTSKNLSHFLKSRYGGFAESKVKLGPLPLIREAYRKLQERLYSA